MISSKARASKMSARASDWCDVETLRFDLGLGDGDGELDIALMRHRDAAVARIQQYTGLPLVDRNVTTRFYPPASDKPAFVGNILYPRGGSQPWFVVGILPFRNESRRLPFDYGDRYCSRRSGQERRKMVPLTTNCGMAWKWWTCGSSCPCGGNDRLGASPYHYGGIVAGTRVFQEHPRDAENPCLGTGIGIGRILERAGDKINESHPHDLIA